MNKILKQVLHNPADNTILITISDEVKSSTMKKVYNLFLDEEIELENPKENKNVGRK